MATSGPVRRPRLITGLEGHWPPSQFRTAPEPHVHRSGAHRPRSAPRGPALRRILRLHRRRRPTRLGAPTAGRGSSGGVRGPEGIRPPLGDTDPCPVAMGLQRQDEAEEYPTAVAWQEPDRSGWVWPAYSRPVNPLRPTMCSGSVTWPSCATPHGSSARKRMGSPSPQSCRCCCDAPRDVRCTRVHHLSGSGPPTAEASRLMSTTNPRRNPAAETAAGPKGRPPSPGPPVAAAVVVSRETVPGGDGSRWPRRSLPAADLVELLRERLRLRDQAVA